MYSVNAYAAPDAHSPLLPVKIRRCEPGPTDVLIDIMYCGICHTDIDIARGRFPPTIPGVDPSQTPFGMPAFPRVPGHEIVGSVVRVGENATLYRPGDVVGVGVLAGSCRVCSECRASEEQFCDQVSFIILGKDRDRHTPLHGGFSTRITADENYVVRIPDALSAATSAPMLCGGITTYSPLRHWNIGNSSRVGVVGLGGLGHLAVKFASAMGAEVTVLSRTDAKQSDALRLGASDFAATENPANWARLAGRFDLILNTVSARINYDSYIHLLKRDGTLVLIGLTDGEVTFNAYGLLGKRRTISSSIGGGIRETQEMLDFSALHRIEPVVELISIDQVNEAFDRMLRGDIRYRFVIDMASLRR